MCSFLKTLFGPKPNPYIDGDTPTLKQLRDKCIEGYDTHKAYIDRPQYCNEQTGSVEHHKEWCWWYDQLIKHLEKEM